jgi:hypothetical protein
MTQSTRWRLSRLLRCSSKCVGPIIGSTERKCTSAGAFRMASIRLRYWSASTVVPSHPCSQPSSPQSSGSSRTRFEGRFVRKSQSSAQHFRARFHIRCFSSRSLGLTSATSAIEAQNTRRRSPFASAVLCQRRGSFQWPSPNMRRGASAPQT